MQLYPAIDMKGGKCVRLTQGLFDNVKVYSDTPADMAKLWVSQGASFLHIVDLDGALAGHSVNEDAIRAIVSSVSVHIELGGGIRSAEAVKNMLDLGITRCIIGTRAVERPEFMKELVETFGPDRIVAGVDAKNGMVAVEGWEKVSSLSALDLCQQMKKFGVKHIVYTDISKDGTLTGPNVGVHKASDGKDRSGCDRPPAEFPAWMTLPACMRAASGEPSSEKHCMRKKSACRMR